MNKRKAKQITNSNRVLETSYKSPSSNQENSVGGNFSQNNTGEGHWQKNLCLNLHDKSVILPVVKTDNYMRSFCHSPGNNISSGSEFHTPTRKNKYATASPKSFVSKQALNINKFCVNISKTLLLKSSLYPDQNNNCGIERIQAVGITVLNSTNKPLF